jgi:hypothetical protein
MLSAPRFLREAGGGATRGARGGGRTLAGGPLGSGVATPLEDLALITHRTAGYRPRPLNAHERALIIASDN